MIKRILTIALVVVLFSSCGTIRIDPDPFAEDPFSEDPFSEDVALTIYDIAEGLTGCPAEILRGLHFAESSYGANLDHPGTFDRGPFGLSEKYHAERAAKWGEYNPDCPLQSAIIAGHIIMENRAMLGSYELAVCAFRQGVTGVRRNGAGLWYYDRVIHAPSV